MNGQQHKEKVEFLKYQIEKEANLESHQKDVDDFLANLKKDERATSQMFN